MGAAKACGALIVKTNNATEFVGKKFATAQEDLIREFAKNATESLDQVSSMIEVVLLQTLGRRVVINHGMLVMVGPLYLFVWSIEADMVWGFEVRG